MKYKIQKTKGYYKNLKKIDPTFQKRIEAAIEENLSDDPYSCPNCQKLKRPTHGATYRLRVGNYRVFYNIDENNKAVIVYWVKKRSNAYL